MNIVIINYFNKQIKSLARKHKNLLDEVIFELENFDTKNAVDLGANVYKIRIRSANLNKGKSKSFRLIIIFINSGNILSPLTIYFKGDKDNISDQEITTHITNVLVEINE